MQGVLGGQREMKQEEEHLGQPTPQRSGGKTLAQGMLPRGWQCR